jgi:hypothetical protein
MEKLKEQSDPQLAHLIFELGEKYPVLIDGERMDPMNEIYGLFDARVEISLQSRRRIILALGAIGQFILDLENAWDADIQPIL